MKIMKFVVLMMLALLLAACGGGSGGKAPPSAPAVPGYPAFVAPYPQVLSQVTTPHVIPKPTIIPVFFPGTLDQAATITFLNQLIASGLWTSLGQYGVGAATVGTPIQIASAPAASITTADVKSFVTTNAPTWSQDGSKIYVLIYPASTSITDIGGSAYHGWTTVNNVLYPFAVIPTLSGWTYATYAYMVWHEISEAATDPNMYGFSALSKDWTSWANLNGGGVEVADMCGGYEFYIDSTIGNLSMKPVWSNLAASQGDPCSDRTRGGEYGFGAFPVLPDIYTEPYGIQNPAVTLTDASVKIAPGTSVTIPVKLFSFGPLDQPMQLSAIETDKNTPPLVFSFSKTSGVNGDTVNLTITAPAAAFPTATPYATFVIIAAATDALGQVRYRYFTGMVTN